MLAGTVSCTLGPLLYAAAPVMVVTRAAGSSAKRDSPAAKSSEKSVVGSGPVAVPRTTTLSMSAPSQVASKSPLALTRKRRLIPARLFAVAGSVNVGAAQAVAAVVASDV